MGELLSVFVVSTLIPFVLESLKSASWFPMARVAPIANRIVPIVVALVTASGVTYTFADGTLSVHHLVPSEIAHNLLLAGWAWVTSWGVYRRFINA